MNSIFLPWTKQTIIMAATLCFSLTHAQPIQLETVKQHMTDPAVRAFLDTIAYAEGTFNSKGYKTQYTYKYFNDFSDHPREVICKEYKGSMLCSTAAGRYQFLKRTWDGIAPQIAAGDFSPVNQDLAAIALLMEHDAIDLIRAQDFVHAIYKVNKVWASLPGAPYGQPTRSLAELRHIFMNRLHFYQKNKKVDRKLKNQLRKRPLSTSQGEQERLT